MITSGLVNQKRARFDNGFIHQRDVNARDTTIRPYQSGVDMPIVEKSSYASPPVTEFTKRGTPVKPPNQIFYNDIFRKNLTPSQRLFIAQSIKQLTRIGSTTLGDMTRPPTGQGPWGGPGPGYYGGPGYGGQGPGGQGPGGPAPPTDPTLPGLMTPSENSVDDVFMNSADTLEDELDAVDTVENTDGERVISNMVNIAVNTIEQPEYDTGKVKEIVARMNAGEPISIGAWNDGSKMKQTKIIDSYLSRIQKGATSTRNVVGDVVKGVVNTAGMAKAGAKATASGIGAAGKLATKIVPGIYEVGKAGLGAGSKISTSLGNATSKIFTAAGAAGSDVLQSAAPAVSRSLRLTGNIASPMIDVAGTATALTIRGAGAVGSTALNIGAGTARVGNFLAERWAPMVTNGIIDTLQPTTDWVQRMIHETGAAVLASTSQLAIAQLILIDNYLRSIGRNVRNVDPFRLVEDQNLGINRTEVNDRIKGNGVGAYRYGVSQRHPESFSKRVNIASPHQPEKRVNRSRGNLDTTQRVPAIEETPPLNQGEGSSRSTATPKKQKKAPEMVDVRRSPRLIKKNEAKRLALEESFKAEKAGLKRPKRNL